MRFLNKFQIVRKRSIRPETFFLSPSLKNEDLQNPGLS